MELGTKRWQSAPPSLALPRRIGISCPEKSSSVKSEFLFLFGVGSWGRWRTVPPSDTGRIALTWKQWLLACSLFGCLMSMVQELTRSFLIMSSALITRLSVYNYTIRWKDYLLNPGDSGGHFLILALLSNNSSWTVIVTPKDHKVPKHSDHLGREELEFLPDYQPRSASALA